MLLLWAWCVCYQQVLVLSRCQWDRVVAASFAGTTTPTRAAVKGLHTAVAVATPIASTAPSSVSAHVHGNRMLTSASPWQPARPLPTACLVGAVLRWCITNSSAWFDQIYCNVRFRQGPSSLYRVCAAYAQWKTGCRKINRWEISKKIFVHSSDFVRVDWWLLCVWKDDTDVAH